MKLKWIYLVSLLIMSYAVHANEYIILHVKGKVTLKKTGAQLKPSDKVNEEDEIVFGSADALVAVMHPSKGRFLMKPNQAQGQKSGEGELISFVKNTLVAGTGRASSRAGKLTNDLAFKQLLEANPLEYFDGQFAFIGDTAKLQVSLEAYPLSKKDFFFVRYKYNGETINKKVPHQDDHIIFSSVGLFTIDGKPIPHQEAKDFQLFFRKSATSESRFICAFQPIFVDKEELKREYELLLPYLKGKTATEQLGEMQAYMADAHGKVDVDQLKGFLNLD